MLRRFRCLPKDETAQGVIGLSKKSQASGADAVGRPRKLRTDRSIPTNRESAPEAVLLSLAR